jgi:uncharacterized membrane protein
MAKKSDIIVVGVIAVGAIVVAWLVLNKPMSTVNNGYRKPSATPNTNTASVGSILQGVVGLISSNQTPTVLPNGQINDVGVIDPNAGLDVTDYGST